MSCDLYELSELPPEPRRRRIPPPLRRRVIAPLLRRRRTGAAAAGALTTTTPFWEETVAVFRFAIPSVYTGRADSAEPADGSGRTDPTERLSPAPFRGFLQGFGPSTYTHSDRGQRGQHPRAT